MDNNVNEVKEKEEYSLNDDRRVKVLSPGAMVAKRFFRNRLAVIGLIMLLAMFIFSFIGGLVSPYGQDEQFFTTQEQQKEYVGVTQNDDLRYTVADGQEFSGILQAQFLLAQGRGETSFTYNDVTYDIVEEGPDMYSIYAGDTLLAVAAKDIITEEAGTRLESGQFIDQSGRPLGRHRGQQAYTIGQRRGLGVSAPHPLYVAEKDPGRNTITLAENSALFHSGLVGREVSWLPFDTPARPLRVTAKIRYSQSETSATVTPLDGGRVLVRFDAPQRAIAPGQTVAFYDGEQVLGGAVIDHIAD